MDIEDAEACYRAVKSRDRRFDGVFYTAVRSTGIYCRPSCPAITPHRKNVTFYRTAAAAQGAGFRACKRCLPDATPGSPDWDFSADAAGRAMRLIADGVVEREGVTGLAARVGYTPRHLSRLLTHEVGAGPLALARARRAQTARILVETTPMPFADVAFAAGFSSIRQFNDTVREVYAATPTSLRGRAARPAPPTVASSCGSRCAVPTPAPTWSPSWPCAPSTASRRPGPAGTPAPCGCRTGRPGMAAGRRRGRPGLRPLHPPGRRPAGRLGRGGALPQAARRRLRPRRGRRRARGRPPARPAGPAAARAAGPGHVDGHEVAVRAVLGQQVSVGAARRLAALLVERHGEVVDGDLAASPDGAEHTLLRLFPSAETLAGVDPETLPMPRARGRALVALCAALAAGDIPLDRSADRADVRRALLAVPGIGPWTAGYVALRALGDPDVFLPTDVGVRNGLRALGEDPARAETLGEAWRPWRSYALMHLWAASGDAAAAVRREPPDPTDRSA